MFIQSFSKIGALHFCTSKKMSTEQAKAYAIQDLRNESYRNCTIGKVYVNDELVLENIKTS